MKKKLIAAVTSLVMVATMVPATVSATVQPDAAKATAAAAEAEAPAVTAFKNAVKAIPADGTADYGYTANYKAALDKAEQAYAALTMAQQAEVTTEKGTLDAAKNSYNGWKTAVEEVNAKIKELPSKLGKDVAANVIAYEDFYNTNFNTGLKAVIEKYNELNEGNVKGQKEAVEGMDKLHALADTDANGTLVTDVGTKALLYKALNAIKTLTNIDGSNYTTGMNAANTAVEALTSTQVAMIATADWNKYQKNNQTAKEATKLMKAYTDAEKALDDKYSSVNPIPADKIADADALCKAAEDAYKALEAIAQLQDKATNYESKVKAVRTKITSAQDLVEGNTEAKAVLDRIGSLPKSSAITDLTYYDEVNAIFEAYGQLSSKGQKAVKASPLAADFDAVSKKLVTVYNNLTAEEQAARAKAALAKLPSADYAVNLAAKKEYEMATASNVEAPYITTSAGNYSGKALADTSYFEQAEIDKYNAIDGDLTVAYTAEVNEIVKLVENIKANELASMTAEQFAAAKATIDKAESAVKGLSAGAKALYKGGSIQVGSTTPIKTYVETLLTKRDARIGKDTADALKVRMGSIVKITADNLNVQKPIIEALRADYDAFAKNVEDDVYGSEYAVNPFGSTDAAYLNYLTTAEAEIAALEVGQDAAKVDALIDTLTVLDKSKTYTAEELLKAREANAAARAAYDALSAAEVEKVTKFAKLVEAEAAVKAAENNTIKAEGEKIGAVGMVLTDAQIQQYGIVNNLLKTLEKSSADLTGTAKAYYDAAKAKMQILYPNGKAADSALEAINDSSAAADIAAAREAYDKLTDIEKTVVQPENLEKLISAETKGTNKDALLSNATVAAIEDQVYTGDQIRPTVKITDAKQKELKENTDYVVSYDKNVLVGTAVITITGKGTYAGTIQVPFNIVGIDVKDAAVSEIAEQNYTGSAITPEFTVKVNDKTLVEGEDYTAEYANNVNAGTASVTIKGMGNYSGTKAVSFKIKTVALKAADVTGVVSKTYTGKALTQKVVVKANGKTLKNGTDYTVSYKNNKNVGKAAVTVKAKGNYTGTITKTFIVKPAKESITSLKKGTKRFTVKYKKQTGAKYQIYYKTAGSKAKTVKTSAVTKTVKNLKKGKTYTVKVRAYKAIDGKTYYGAYSKAKKVKVR